MSLSTPIGGSYMLNRGLSGAVWKQCPPNRISRHTRTIPLRCQPTPALFQQRSHFGLRSFNGVSKVFIENGAKPQVRPIRTYTYVHYQPPKRRWPRFILNTFLFLSAGVTIAAGIRLFLVKRASDKNKAHAQELYAKIDRAFADSRNRTHEELRAITFECARMSVYWKLPDDRQDQQLIIEECGPLDTPIELSDGGVIDAADTCYFEIRPAQLPEADAAIIYLAVNAESNARKTRMRDVMRGAFDEKFARQLHGNEPCVIHVMLRSQVQSVFCMPGVRHPGPDTWVVKLMDGARM